MSNNNELFGKKNVRLRQDRSSTWAYRDAPKDVFCVIMQNDNEFHRPEYVYVSGQEISVSNEYRIDEGRHFDLQSYFGIVNTKPSLPCRQASFVRSERQNGDCEAKFFR